MGSTLYLSTMFAALCSIATGQAYAQAAAPAHTWANERVSQTVADLPSENYRFETHLLHSEDRNRRYQVQIAIPKTPAPSDGYTVLYMLDGNAVIDTLTGPDLEHLAQRQPPVLVAIGYDVPTRNDVVSRAFDYTPLVVVNGQTIAKPTVRGRVGGGADIFFQFIENKVKPLVRSRTSVSDKAYLWGHSYGGLFAMHVLFTHPQAFHGYIVGDPSAWWHDGALLDEWARLDKSQLSTVRLDVLVGTKPRPPGRPAPYDDEVTTPEGRQVNLRTAVHDITEILRKQGATVSYETFPQFGHGEMIRVSLVHALRVASTP